MQTIRLTGLALATALSLAACGGADTSAPAARSAPSADTAAAQNATALAVTEKPVFNSANAVVQTAKLATAAAPAPVVSVTLNSKRAVGASVDLGAPSAADLEKRLQNNQKSGSKPVAKAYQIGFSRPVTAATSAKSVQQLLSWSTTETGAQRAVVRFSSTGAKGLRLGMLVQSLPDDLTLRFYADGSSEAQQTSGAYINATVRANVKADGDSTAARTYWTPTTQGETTVLELELPAGRDAASVAFTIPSLAHQVETAVQASLDQIAAKSSCPGVTPDATCTTPLPPAANAVSALDFVADGGSFVCTGTLIANRGSTQQGYMLTANHCINTQAIASSLVTNWFYRSASCNSAAVNPGWAIQSAGATLLFNQGEFSPSLGNPTGTDTALLKLNAAPPSGAVYAGWEFGRQGINTGATFVSLHHPAGGSESRLRRSDGRLTSYVNLLSEDAQGNLFGDSGNKPAYPMYVVTWSSGITEGGSSGSALFKDVTTSNPKILGTLWGGGSSCTDTTAPDYYGRFDLAYENGLINWLNPGYAMVFRFYNLGNGTHFYSANVTERNNVRATIPSLQYEDPVFAVSPSAGSGLSPVYRFYNTNTGVHFYTINETERDAVKTYPGFNFEGIAWYASKSDNPAPGSIEVFRFQHRATGTHLYTANVAERNNIINTLGASYNYEGVAYRAWPAEI